MTGTLAPDLVEPLLRGRFGRPYVHAASCASTQELLLDDLPEGAVAVCERQTAGRGRLGRRWDAPAGRAILCSILLRPALTRRVGELSLVGGLAVARTVERATGNPVGIKWPNDVLLGGRKVAGILADAHGSAVVLGIGLNVNQEPGELPDRAPVRAGSLFGFDGARRERAPLLADLLGELEDAYASWLAEGLLTLIFDLRARDVLRGRTVTVGGLTGIAGGVAPDGSLEIESEAGPVAVQSGEVTVASDEQLDFPQR